MINSVICNCIPIYVPDINHIVTASMRTSGQYHARCQGHTEVEAGIGSREGKGPAVREGPAECHSMSLQMGYTPGTEFPRKCVRWHLPASHLARKSRESVSGVFPRCPPGTESPQKRSRCPFLPPTCHGFPAKSWQVSHPSSHLPQRPRRCFGGKR